MKKFIKQHWKIITAFLYLCALVTLFLPGLVASLCGAIFAILGYRMLTLYL